EKTELLVPAVRWRGKPATLTTLHLCLGIVLCGLEGFGSQLKLWRRLCLEPIGPFAPVRVVDQAIYNRLARAAGVMRLFFEQVSGWMAQQLEGLEDRTLAPWATQVLALDESTLDAVGRWLPELRALLPGDPRLLAGRISALFDLRRQQWVRVEVWQEAVANCKQQARLLLEGLQVGTLLLFDRGYLSFPWFDELTECQLWWISRYANQASMQVRHILYQGDGVLDAIVWLGKYRADRAKYAVRLVQFYHHRRLHRYLTNVLDPQQLSLADVARLYARRWDIELAFGVLKEHLQLGHLWSAKWEVVQVQIWCALLLAQLFHGLQVQLAAQEGVDPFDVSIELLVELVPGLLQRGIAPLSALGRRGREVGLIRPSTRLQVQVPFVDATWMSPAPPEALQPRETARYAQRKCEPGKRPKTKKAG
ncbi:MAG TPA: IS4 family transposase, partial [Ktedonobacteraceae bacterium]|nr:IS4 family transposase [Ktedonobacteraceae bacterium]